MINGTRLQSDTIVHQQNQIDKLADAMNVLALEVRNNSISQKHTYDLIQNLNSRVDKLLDKVEKLLEKDIRQEAVLGLLYKVWRYSPYIIATIFFITLAVSETSFDFSKFAAILVNKYIGK